MPPLYCPFTPQIWAAQLLLNVYSTGNWLHPVKVQVTSSPPLGCCCSAATQVTFLLHTVHLNLDNISITLQVWSGGEIFKVAAFNTSGCACIVFPGRHNAAHSLPHNLMHCSICVSFTIEVVMELHNKLHATLGMLSIHL